MVQYVLTPWRDRHELLLVRRQFYALAPRHGVDDDTDAGVGVAGESEGEGASWLGGGRLQISGGAGGGSSSGSSSRLAGVPVPADNDDDREGHHDDRGALADDDAQRREEKMRRRRQQQHRQAVARVSMWMQRGNCPHMVESTALLTAAMLSDEDADLAVDSAASAAYATRAAYSAAFSRYVERTQAVLYLQETFVSPVSPVDGVVHDIGV
jgi:hypothetical protein